MSSRKLLGNVRGRHRQELYSLSQFEEALRKAHKDLKRFTPLERTFDFNKFFKPMKNKLEKNIQEAYEIELRVNAEGNVMIRSKPHMSHHVAFSAWSTYWPPPREAWIKGVQPACPPFDGVPDLTPLQIWSKWDRAAPALSDYYNDSVWCSDAGAKYEMTALLRQWGDDPRRAPWSRPLWPTWDEAMPPADPDQDRRVPPIERRRRFPTVRAPYDRIGAILFPQRRGRGRGRGGRGRGRGGRGRGGGGRGRGGKRRRVDSSSSSEEEFRLSPKRPQPRRRRVGVRIHPDYVGRRVRVPASLFRIDKDIYYLGTVNRWGRYKNTNGQNSHGYYIHYDEGDRYWMIESNVHKYVM